jgi:hypothetical protein
VGNNHLEVVFALPGFHHWLRVDHFDRFPMKVNGGLAKQVFGSNVNQALQAPSPCRS